MVKFSWLPTLAAVTLGCVTAGCGTAARDHRPQAAPPPPTPAVRAAPAAAPVPSQDSVQALIDESQQHFVQGQKELALGHLDRARSEFNRAIDLLLGAPGGARLEPRLREQFDRLVDRISALEVTALAEGDGFTEKPSEPASIDELLTLATTFPTTAPTPTVARTVESDLAQTSHDIAIPLNDRVLGYVELFQGRLRSYIQEGLDRGSPYLPMIQSVFRAEGLPLDLAYVPLIESAFKTNALSRTKAKGVWQFMHATGLENGLKHDWYVDERSDPEKATRAAAKYLKALRGMFDGDWHLALASYNGGPGRVQRAMKRTGREDFWSLSANPKWLPRETREYVPMILAAVIIARNPAQYGFSLAATSPLPYEAVTVNGPLDLRRVAEWTGTSVDVIQALNPELRRWTTPVRTQAYALRVPPGTAAQLQQRVTSISDADRGALNWHTVRSGQTIATIARSLRVNRADLAEANYLPVNARVRPGQKLVIPRAPAVLMASEPDRPTPTAESRPIVERAMVSTAPDAESSSQVRRVYRVKRGDTLASIARVFETTVGSLKQWNRLRSNIISPGQRLTVFMASRR
jgi:membrane-bound lytic murein transglycosylase D